MDENTPDDTRRELQHRIQLLKEQFERGNIQFAPAIADEMKRSLLAVRYAPDGSVDLSTVDGRVRSMALGVAMLKRRNDLRTSISLSEIQNAYFNLIQSNFGHLHKRMRDQKLNPHFAAFAASRDPDFVNQITPAIPDFVGAVVNFWQSVGESAHIHVEDLPVVKAVYGGDFFPSSYQNIASTCGVYLDTIVLPDPLLRSAAMFEHWPLERQTYYVVKHALNILGYRDLALADVTPPIVVILPDRVLLDPQQYQVMEHVALSDTVLHANKVFGREFRTHDELIAFLDDFRDIESLMREIARPDRVLFDIEWEGSIQEQFERVRREQPEIQVIAPTQARLIAVQAFGRMAQSNDLLPWRRIGQCQDVRHIKLHKANGIGGNGCGDEECGEGQIHAKHGVSYNGHPGWRPRLRTPRCNEHAPGSPSLEAWP